MYDNWLVSVGGLCEPPRPALAAILDCALQVLWRLLNVPFTIAQALEP